MKFKFLVVSALVLIYSISCNNSENNNPKMNNSEDSTAQNNFKLKEDTVSLSIDNKNYVGYVVYDENIQDKRPGIIVVPEWWGLNDYIRERAKKLAELGYVALAIDMYGDGKVANDPAAAQEYANTYYDDPQLTKTHIDAAIQKIKTFPQTDSSNIAAIGYCFGGFVVLNAAKLGADLDGVVSFHGGLGGVAPQKDLLKAKILVCHGGADEFENGNVAEFKKQMDSVGANYTFKVYPGASHAFSNPKATEVGEKFNIPIKYNEAADTASWNDMKQFFKEIFHS
jgi:dienelactone hydrolase